MTIHRAVLKRLALVSILVLLAASVIASVALADQAVTILTAPIHTGASIYMEINHDGIHQPEELVGIFDVYDGNRPITFTWNAYSFPPDVSGAYRISVWQNTTPLGVPTWVETNVAHHWASNPNPTTFTYGPIGQQAAICSGCPTRIQVTPETYELYQTENGSYGYRYQPIAAAYPAALTNSEEFVLETFMVAPELESGSERGEPLSPEITCEQGWAEFCANDACPFLNEFWCPDGNQATCEALFAASEADGYCDKCGLENNWCIDPGT